MASKKYCIVFTMTAESDIDETIEYIASDLSNPEAASAFVDELQEKLEETSQTPKSGKVVENEFLKRDDVRRFLVGHFIVYYIIDESVGDIVILRVVYEKRDQDNILKYI